MKRSTTILTMLAMGSTGLLILPSTASAGSPEDDVRCGVTITADTTLQHDLLNCPGIGLVVGADNLTLNLNGHTIDGDGSPATCTTVVPCDVGVDNRAGHDRVRIEGGFVREFGTGVYLATVEANRLHRLRVAQSHEFGVVVADASRTTIEDSVLAENGTSGIVVGRSRHIVMDSNVVTGSRGYALFTFDLENSRVQNNKLDLNDHGVAVFGRSRGNLVGDNLVTRSGGSAVDVGGGEDNRVERNRLVDNGDGIILTDERGAVVNGNDVNRTGFYGFPDTGGFSIILDGADANIISHNHVAGGRGPALLVTKLDSATDADENDLTRNVALRNSSDGIVVGIGASRTKVRRNVALANGDDGIDIESTSTTLTANVTKRNKDLGIEAVDGVIDGGGNRASANGNALQCTAVVCRDGRNL